MGRSVFAHSLFSHLRICSTRAWEDEPLYLSWNRQGLWLVADLKTALGQVWNCYVCRWLWKLILSLLFGVALVCNELATLKVHNLCWTLCTHVHLFINTGFTLPTLNRLNYRFRVPESSLVKLLPQYTWNAVTDRHHHFQPYCWFLNIFLTNPGALALNMLHISLNIRIGFRADCRPQIICAAFFDIGLRSRDLKAPSWSD